MEYEILRLGHHGDGIAEGPVFVPRALPGERVTGELDGTRLTNVKVALPSDDRVKPSCRHYKSCGGCQVMHASETFVANWKQDVVRQSLSHYGLAPAMRPILTSEAASRRRAGFAARRTKANAMVGFHGRASDVLVETPDCHLLTPGLLAARDAVKALAKTAGSRKSVLSALSTETEEGLDIDVSGAKPLEDRLRAELAGIAEQFKLARLSWDGDVVVLRAPPRVRFAGHAVTLPPRAFLQATQTGQDALIAAMREAVDGARHIVDLFSGCGTFSLPLAETADVHAVETDREMLSALDHGWRHAHGLKKVTTEARDLFRNPLDRVDLARFDAAVFDPPRAGAEAQVRHLAEAGPALLGAVSCNPVTFARDAKTLIDGGYRLNWVQVVDQFRWSSHIELAAQFTRDHM